MKIPHFRAAKGKQLTLGIAVAVLFCTSPGLISLANAQTFGSSYTSTAPKDCRVSSVGNGIDDNSDQDKDGRPIAKPLLAVTRLPPGAVCHVAYVDVKANPDANELARRAADENARDFKCGKDELKVIGAGGRAVELAQRR